MTLENWRWRFKLGTETTFMSKLTRSVLHVAQNLIWDHITIGISTTWALGCGRPAGVNVVICTPPFV
jgi:hypothetical protein